MRHRRGLTIETPPSPLIESHRIGRHHDYVAAIERTLGLLGVTDFEYQLRAGGHCAVIIRHRDRQRRVFFPSTSRAFEGPRNCACIVRRTVRSEKERQ